MLLPPVALLLGELQRWVRQGGKDATARAGEIVEKTLADYERPPIDEAVLEELEDFVARRRAELGD